MTNLIIEGRVASKKNSKQIIRRAGRTFLISSSAFTRFKNEAVRQIREQTKDFYTQKIKVKYNFHIKGDLRIDIDNAIASINDILQDAHVIIDDDNIIEIEAAKSNGHKEHLTMVHIYA